MLLFNQLATHLATHERITTTVTKAKAIRPLAEKIMNWARRLSLDKTDYQARMELGRHLDTNFAFKKAIFEIASRFKDKQNNFTRIVPLQ